MMPINVSFNWRTEFDKWTSKSDYQVLMYDMSNEERGRDIVKCRIAMLQKWFDKGVSFLLDIFFLLDLAKDKAIKKRSLK